jgi:hypothetical protein
VHKQDADGVPDDLVDELFAATCIQVGWLGLSARTRCMFEMANRELSASAQAHWLGWRARRGERASEQAFHCKIHGYTGVDVT